MQRLSLISPIPWSDLPRSDDPSPGPAPLAPPISPWSAGLFIARRLPAQRALLCAQTSTTG
jgi:hypothetical protein